MITRPKFKDHWLVQPNNTEIISQASQVQIYNQSQTMIANWPYYKTNFQTLVLSLKKIQRKNEQIIMIGKVQDLEIAITQLNKCNFVLVELFSQTRLSYRGFVSWFLIGNLKYSFLIDGIALRNHLENLLKIFENANIIKFAFNCKDMTQSLKRDFSIFSVNIFDLFFLEKFYQNLSNVGNELRTDTIKSQNQQMIYQRPIKQIMNNFVSKIYEKLVLYLTHLPLKNNSNNYYEQMYYVEILNNYQQINNSQFFMHYYQHLPVSCITSQEYQNLNPKMEKLSFQLNNFREHVAKMYDVSADFVMPRSIFLKILENSRISVLEIWQLYEGLNNKSIGLEMCKRIYDVIQLNQQLFEQEQKLKQLFGEQTQFKKQKEMNQKQYIRKLLKDLKWGDSGQWLNRKDDPSIKLYKEIISINQFDHSIGEQYVSKMKGDVLKKSQISRFLKYAQYMRNKDYGKLETLYMMSKQIKESNNKQDQFSQGNQELQVKSQKKDKKLKFARNLFDQSEQKPKDIQSTTSLEQKETKKEINKQQISKKKCTTVKNLVQKKFQNVEQQGSDSQSRKSSQSNSFSILQIDQILIRRSDIKPLPNTIEQIYQMAQQAKKKADKKSKKEKKKNQPSKKDIEFIPTYQDIEELINFATNK